MNRIKQLREENNWTQLELSKKMNCAMSSIAMYESETRKPSMEVLLKLSEIFDCSIDYILGKSDIRNTEEFKYAYHRPKEADGLSDEEVNDALRFYKEMKKKIEGEKK